MNSSVITLEDEPTGAGPWDYAIDGLGVPDVLAHWDVDTLPPPPDSYIGTWRAAASTHTLTGAAAAVQTEDAEHFRARFDGIDDYLFLNVASLGVKTVAALVRHPVAGAAGSYLSFGGTYMRVNSSGGYNLTGGTAQFPTVQRSVQKWNWVFLSQDGSARTFAQNDEPAVTGTGGTSGITKIEIGRNIAGGDYGGNPMYVAAVAAFTRVLTAAERAAMWSTLQANRPTWTA